MATDKEKQREKTTIEVSLDTREALAEMACKRESYNTVIQRLLEISRKVRKGCKCTWIKAHAPDEDDQLFILALDFRTKPTEESNREFVERVISEQLDAMGIAL